MFETFEVFVLLNSLKAFDKYLAFMRKNL